jgi:hypothetical protein
MAEPVPGAESTVAPVPDPLPASVLPPESAVLGAPAEPISHSPAPAQPVLTDELAVGVESIPDHGVATRLSVISAKWSKFRFSPDQGQGVQKWQVSIPGLTDIRVFQQVVRDTEGHPCDISTNTAEILWEIASAVGYSDLQGRIVTFYSSLSTENRLIAIGKLSAEYPCEELEGMLAEDLDYLLDEAIRPKLLALPEESIARILSHPNRNVKNINALISVVQHIFEVGGDAVKSRIGQILPFGKLPVNRTVTGLLDRFQPNDLVLVPVSLLREFFALKKRIDAIGSAFDEVIRPYQRRK